MQRQAVLEQGLPGWAESEWSGTAAYRLRWHIWLFSWTLFFFFVAADNGNLWRDLQLGNATLLDETSCAWPKHARYVCGAKMELLPHNNVCWHQHDASAGAWQLLHSQPEQLASGLLTPAATQRYLRKKIASMNSCRTTFMIRNNFRIHQVPQLTVYQTKYLQKAWQCRGQLTARQLTEWLLT